MYVGQLYLNMRPLLVVDDILSVTLLKKTDFPYLKRYKRQVNC